MGASLKSLLVTAAACLALLAAGVAPAGAAVPCWKTLINDWLDGRIDGTYPARCYEEAIQHVPQDVAIYGNISEDFRRALANAFRHRGPGQELIVPAATRDHSKHHGPFGGLLDRLGPKNAESVPLPLLVLGGIALLLMAAAGASFLARVIQAKRRA